MRSLPPLRILALLAAVFLCRAAAAAEINVSIGAVTWFLGDGDDAGFADARGHNARFSNPTSCTATRNGTLMITDQFNHRIRRVFYPRNDSVQTWIGRQPNPAGLFSSGGLATIFPANVGLNAYVSYPTAITITADGTFAFFVERFNQISSINVASSFKNAFVGAPASGLADGTGTAARFQLPKCLDIFHATTDIFVGEFGRIRRVTRAGVVRHFSGNQLATPFQIDGTNTSSYYIDVRGLTIAQSSGIMYVTDGIVVRRVFTNGSVTTIAGKPLQSGQNDGPAADATFSLPLGIVIDKYEQAVYIVDSSNDVVRRLDLPSMMVHTVVGSGTDGWTSNAVSYLAQIENPQAVCIDHMTQRLFIVGEHSLSFVEMATLTESSSMTMSKSLAGSTSASLGVSESHSANVTVTNSQLQTPSETISVVNCDVQFCTCVGVVSANNMTAVQCADGIGNCTNTRKCTERYEDCLIEFLVPSSACPI